MKEQELTCRCHRSSRARPYLLLSMTRGPKEAARPRRFTAHAVEQGTQAHKPSLPHPPYINATLLTDNQRKGSEFETEGESSREREGKKAPVDPISSMADWGPVVIATVLFVLLTPGLLFQLPAHGRIVGFGTMHTSGIAILVHAVLYFALITIFLIAIGVHIYAG